MDRKRKSELTDHISIADKARQVKLVFGDYLHLVREFIIDYGKVFLPFVLIGCLILTVIISLSARSRVIAAERLAEQAVSENVEEVLEVKDIPFVENAYPEINVLLKNYYNALAGGDIDALLSIQSDVSNTEVIRLSAMADYINHYENLVCYSKPGPVEDSFIVYAYTDVYLEDQLNATPGLQAFYICKDEDRGYYVNTGELTEDEVDYISAISLQDDVIDLKNTVNVNYQTLLEDNKKLNEQWAEISVEIDNEVGEQLAEEAVISAKLEEEEIESGEVEENPLDAEPVIIKVKTNALVNVRKSASATADKLGTAPLGSIYLVREEMSNGWTRIEYEDKDGFIKSEFLDKIEDVSNITSTGKVISLTLLNVRADADASSAKLGVLTEGQSAELIEESGEWCKIKYNDDVGYVKSEYVLIQ